MIFKPWALVSPSTPSENRGKSTPRDRSMYPPYPQYTEFFFLFLYGYGRINTAVYFLIFFLYNTAVSRIRISVYRLYGYGRNPTREWCLLPRQQQTHSPTWYAHVHYVLEQPCQSSEAVKQCNKASTICKHFSIFPKSCIPYSRPSFREFLGCVQERHSFMITPNMGALRTKCCQASVLHRRVTASRDKVGRN